MQIIRRSAFIAVPWKNGGGITHEAIRVPAGQAPFRWRVSLAQIDASGPFSDFAGYDRKMLLLQGAGVHLSFGNGQETYLREVGDLAQFDGALTTGCELLDGPCVDLNFMAAKSLGETQAWVETVSKSRSLELTLGQTALVFSLNGTVAIREGLSGPETIESWDLAVTAPGHSRVIELSAVDLLTPPLVFCVTLSDN